MLCNQSVLSDSGMCNLTLLFMDLFWMQVPTFTIRVGVDFTFRSIISLAMVHVPGNIGFFLQTPLCSFPQVVYFLCIWFVFFSSIWSTVFSCCCCMESLLTVDMEVVAWVSCQTVGSRAEFILSMCPVTCLRHSSVNFWSPAVRMMKRTLHCSLVRSL